MNNQDIMDSSQWNREVERIRQTFSPYDIRNDPEKYKVDVPEGAVRKASVLIPLFMREGQWRILLTLRSKDLTHHAGYVAFPGGMTDDTDKDEIHTALREAEEEIGLDPNDVQVIAVFTQSLLKPNSFVTPVLAVIPADFTPKLNIREVSLVFDLPLERFLSKERSWVSDYHSEVGLTYHVHHFEDDVVDQVVDTWGFTATHCIKIAVGTLQSDQVFRFTNHERPTSKELIFSTDTLKTLLKRMATLTKRPAKL